MARTPRSARPSRPSDDQNHTPDPLSLLDGRSIGAGAAAACGGPVELVFDRQHFERVVLAGMLRARASLAIATADFKSMLVPGATLRGTSDGKTRAGGGRRGNDAPSIVSVLADLASGGVEVRLLHSGVPSIPALRTIKERFGGRLPTGLVVRRCPRLHAKLVVIDCRAMYLGSANLTGAGLGAKSPDKRNFEMGVWTESTALIDAALQRFDALWEGRPCDACRRKDVCPVPLEEPRL